MKLSIVIPVYNAEKYLNKMMDSILRSEEEFEVICVDDGSTDNSLNILQDIQDKRVTVYTKKMKAYTKLGNLGSCFRKVIM